MHGFDHGIAHRQLDEVAAVAAVGVAPVRTGSTGPQGLVGFLENQVASAIGRVNGLDNSIADLIRQKNDAEAEVIRITAMLEKFTSPEPEPTPEPEPGN